MDNNDQLKIGLGESATIKLVSLDPFSQGVNEFKGQKKPWYGYNVTKGTQELTLFASKAVYDLFQAAKPEGEFLFEFRSVKNKDGDQRSIWYLDGKNLWQYQEEVTQAEEALAPPEITINTEPDIQSDVDYGKEIVSIKERLVKLEEWHHKSAVSTDDDIPF